MAESIRQVMTENPVVVSATEPLLTAARLMREHDIGDIVVSDESGFRGILTDRDIVVRALAEDRDPAATSVGDICSEQMHSLGPDDSPEDAITMMRSEAIRRIPVVQDGNLIGMVSMGDLAVERDPRSTLADVSSAPPNE